MTIISNTRSMVEISDVVPGDDVLNQIFTNVKMFSGHSIMEIRNLMNDMMRTIPNVDPACAWKLLGFREEFEKSIPNEEGLTLPLHAIMAVEFAIPALMQLPFPLDGPEEQWISISVRLHGTSTHKGLFLLLIGILILYLETLVKNLCYLNRKKLLPRLCYALEDRPVTPGYRLACLLLFLLLILLRRFYHLTSWSANFSLIENQGHCIPFSLDGKNYDFGVGYYLACSLNYIKYWLGAKFESSEGNVLSNFLFF